MFSFLRHTSKDFSQSSPLLRRWALLFCGQSSQARRGGSSSHGGRRNKNLSIASWPSGEFLYDKHVFELFKH